MSQPNNGTDNAILHASLLRGALSIKVTEMDIRRNYSGSPPPLDDDSTIKSDRSSVRGSAGSSRGLGLGGIKDTLSSLSPIETDYILQIESTNTVKFAKDSRMSVTSLELQELETYSCSKQYVDVRNLANIMRGHAEEMVKYYEDKKGEKSKGTGGKSKKASGSHLFKGLEKLLQKPVEVAQYITNTEPRVSNLVSDLDGVFRDKKRRSSSNNSGKEGGKPQRRTSEVLVQGAPLFVREIMVGVDEFYQAIYSEKRQFGARKTHYDYVKSVAERRKTKINSAFSILVNALAASGVSCVSKKQPELIPVSLERLVRSLEKFLLNDVVVEHGSIVIEKKAADVPQDLLGGSTSHSAVTPVTTRRRASIVDREAEEEICKEVAEMLVTSETTEEKEEEDEVVDLYVAKDSIAAKEGEIKAEEEEIKVPMVIPAGLLPDHPIDFAITVAVGAILFKVLEGRVVNVQIDMLVMIGVACGLIGYQLAGPTLVHVENNTNKGVSSATKKVTILPPSKTKERTVPDRGLARRSTLTKSTGSMDLSNSQNRSLHFIRASLRSVKNLAVGTDDDVAEEKPVVAAQTFAKFPDDAVIGSHLNCWSSPASTNFQIRGPNYLKDKKKVPSGDYLLPCRGCDLFLTDNAPVNLGRNRSILEGKLRDVPTFIINYRLPWGVFLSYHEIPERFLPFLRRGHGHGDLTTPLPSMANMPAGERALCNFLLSDSEEKNKLLKIVPVIVEGPWVVKRVAGGKPAIVGTKLPITYVYQPPENGLAEYLEADLDIVSSAAARNILAVVRSYTQVLTIDLGYVVQGNKAEELPEQMMLGLRLHGLDPLTAELLPEFDDGAHLPVLDEDTGNETE